MCFRAAGEESGERHMAFYGYHNLLRMCVHVYNLHTRAAVDPWSDELRVLGNSADFLELIVQLDGKRLKGKRPFLPSEGVDRENC